MKIAIKGHPTRGKEVIQILENLGGKNGYDQLGSNKNFVYFITNAGLIYSVTPQMCSNECKIYTLEEFEKEFPFKVRDKIIDHEGDVAIITGFVYIEEKLGYSFQYENGRGTATSGILKPYKEMKEERNITLTLDKAKEWYKKDGELREIALQAFTEKELNPLPRSWEEFCKNNPIKTSEAVICFESTIVSCDYSEIRDSDCDREICPSQESAEAHLVMIQLEQLRNCWWNGWEPIWDRSEKWCVRVWGNELSIGITTNISRFLTFPTKEMVREFLECFKDLIEKAKDLI